MGDPEQAARGGAGANGAADISEQAERTAAAIALVTGDWPEQVAHGVADDISDAQVFGAAPPPRAADLHPFPVDGAGDTRARDLASARAAGFARFAPVSEAIAPGTAEADVAGAAAPVPEDDAAEFAAAPEPAPPVVTYLAGAGKRIDLTHPFRIGDREVRFIMVPPPHIGLLMDFADERLPTTFDLAVALTGEDPQVLRALRAGDGNRVLAAVVRALPADIRRAVHVMGGR